MIWNIQLPGDSISNTTSLKILFRDSKQLLPSAHNISITTPVGSLVFPLFMYLRAIFTSSSLIVDTGLSTFACSTQSLHSFLTFVTCDSSKCSYIHAVTLCHPFLVLQEIYSWNIILLLRPQLCNLEHLTTTTIGFNSLNSLSRCRIHCVSYNSLSYFLCFTQVPSIKISINSFYLYMATEISSFLHQLSKCLVYFSFNRRLHQQHLTNWSSVQASIHYRCIWNPHSP